MLPFLEMLVICSAQAQVVLFKTAKLPTILQCRYTHTSLLYRFEILDLPNSLLSYDQEERESPLVERRHSADSAILLPLLPPNLDKFHCLPTNLCSCPKFHCLTHNLEKQFGHVLLCLLSWGRRFLQFEAIYPSQFLKKKKVQTVWEGSVELYKSAICDERAKTLSHLRDLIDGASVPFSSHRLSPFSVDMQIANTVSKVLRFNLGFMKYGVEIDA